MRINWIINFSTKKILKTRDSGGVIKCRSSLSDISRAFELFSQDILTVEGSLASKIYRKSSPQYPKSLRNCNYSASRDI